MGADSRCADAAGELTPMAESKLWTTGAFVVAGAGSMRGTQIIRHNCPLPPVVPKNLRTWLVNEWLLSVRTALAHHGYEADGKAPDIVLEGNLLVCTNKRIFVVEGDLGLIESKRPYAAIGSGSAYALGSLHTRAHGVPSGTRVLDALRASQANCATVSGPFKVVHL